MWELSETGLAAHEQGHSLDKVSLLPGGEFLSIANDRRLWRLNMIRGRTRGFSTRRLHIHFRALLITTQSISRRLGP